ncbi:MAG: 50S ribosomal protein L32 [Patescibacteria group bacterium]|nr:50S ribosomal protein L32 [Patescibacteria group bacterium]
MAVPKRRTSSHRKGRRRAVHAIKLPEVSLCPSCGSDKRPHYACPSCGKLDSGKKTVKAGVKKEKVAVGEKS